VIVQGEVDILIHRGSKDPQGKNETAVARLRRGQSFGEVALVDEGLRSASAISAQKDTRLLVIPRDKIIMLCETYPQLGYRLMYNLAADLAMKIRNTDLRIREQLLYKPAENK
jgi:CRP-like cAMP-binding protein